MGLGVGKKCNFLQFRKCLEQAFSSSVCSSVSILGSSPSIACLGLQVREMGEGRRENWEALHTLSLTSSLTCRVSYKHLPSPFCSQSLLLWFSELPSSSWGKNKQNFFAVSQSSTGKCQEKKKEKATQAFFHFHPPSLSGRPGLQQWACGGVQDFPWGKRKVHAGILLTLTWVCRQCRKACHLWTDKAICMDMVNGVTSDGSTFYKEKATGWDFKCGCFELLQ